MRTFFGILLGALLTIGGAYLYDSTNSGTRSDGVVERPMVNWDVVGRNTSNWMTRVQTMVGNLINSKPSAPPAQTDKMEPPRPNAN